MNKCTALVVSYGGSVPKFEIKSFDPKQAREFIKQETGGETFELCDYFPDLIRKGVHMCANDYTAKGTQRTMTIGPDPITGPVVFAKKKGRKWESLTGRDIIVIYDRLKDGKAQPTYDR